MTESVIDFPKDSLCPEIWEKVVDEDGMQEVWQLKPEVRTKIQEVFEHIVESTQQQFNIVHITGSITSNSYTNNADIDMHLLLDKYEATETEAEQINKSIRTAYQKVFIGKHPIEVYFQPNKFQDFMSVGCYDFFNQKWLVGPEFIDQNFNPYSEYYKEINQKSEKFAQQIRNMIFSIYEISIIYKKNFETDFSKTLRPILIDKLKDVQEMYDNIRQMRKVYSSPESEEQALKYRSSRKWKIADASFKLFDKYGYLAILKQFIEDYKLISSSSSVDEEVIEDILNTVKNYINNADKLSEKEIYEEDNESLVKKTIAYHVSNVPPEKIKREGFKVNQGNGATDTNLFEDLYKEYYPKNYLFISKQPWDINNSNKFRYCYKIDISNMDLYPDFGMLDYFGAYHEEGSDEEGQVFWFEDKDLKSMKNQKLKEFIMKQDGQLTTNEMMGGETVNGEYFPHALYNALGSAVIDGDIVNRKNKIIDVEDRLMHEDEQLDEGAKETISTFALSLALLIPGFVSNKTLQSAKQTFGNNMEEVQKKQNEFKQELNNFDPTQIINGYQMWQAINIFALTLFGEGRGEIKFGGLDPITDTILNRTAKIPDITRIANICVGRREGRAFQYSFWNNNKTALSMIQNGNVIIPKEIKRNMLERKAWEACLQRAIDVYTGNYKVKDPNINSYYVKNMKNPPAWAKQMKNIKIIGSHKFGYVSTNDPDVMDMSTMTPINRKNKIIAQQQTEIPQQKYVVKTGDTLWKIAKQFNTSAKKIAQKNSIKIDGILKIGQTLII